jgi:tripartite-type tricarboxylate transporter receptor subunit TctC
MALTAIRLRHISPKASQARPRSPAASTAALDLVAATSKHCRRRRALIAARERGARMLRLASIMLAAALLAASAAVAQASDTEWPQRPIRLIVPFPAGASTDIIARIVGQKLSQGLGQQIVIENRAGASGNIGADAIAKAAPDGYTIGLATASTHAVAASLNPNLPYDPIKDFAPVAMLGSQPYVLVVHPALPARNLAELIALAKAKPGTLNYGSAGVASVAHLATALFASMAGIDITHVPYKSSAQSVTDMITGRLDMQFATIAPSLPNIQAGQLRALATSGKTRVAVLPQVPTVAEAGIAGYEAALWVAVVAPAATPMTIIARLNRMVNEILNSTDGTEALIAQGMTAEAGAPDAVTQRIRDDIAKWRNVAAKAGIRAE